MPSSTEPVVGRYYHTARTAHLERLSSFREGWFYYTTSRADFDQPLADSNPLVRRASALVVALDVLRKNLSLLEVPEALAIKLWPHLLVVHTAIRLGQIGRRKKTKIVTYAMENYPTDLKLSEFTKLPLFVSRILVSAMASYLVGTTDRIVFATQDAKEVYEHLIPRALARPSLRKYLIWALPSRHEAGNSSMAPADISIDTVIFLGTFESRKGIDSLMNAWPEVRRVRPEAQLLLLGKAGKIQRIRDFAESDSSVHLIEDPERSLIFDQLSRSKVLVLHSQPARGWKEQVGLPIVEALSVGCEIVSSDETGIRDWLADHRHQVVPAAASAQVLGEAIVRALSSTRTKEEIMADLPIIDGRLEADQILMGL